MSRTQPPAQIEIVSGPGTGARVELPLGKSATIGRGTDATLVVPDVGVSRRHVELEHRPDGVLVKDLGSKHGARLDGHAVPLAGVLVGVRGVLAVGPSTIVISRLAMRTTIEAPPGIRLEEKLGVGGSGEVFAAWQDPPGRRVAVKVLAAQAAPTAASRVRREAALAGARLDHPNVVRVHEVLEHGGRTFLVRELVHGTPLDRSLAHGALPWARAARLGAEVAAALAHAHERAVIHRDVKPGNVIVEEASGRARLADFDLARDATTRQTVAEVTRLTATGEGLGTLCYVAPEQLEEARRAGPAADVYGLAATLYHALSGERPFGRTRPEDYLRALFGDGPTSLDEVAPAVPAPLRALVTTGLSTDPKLRPGARDLGTRLLELAR